LVAEEMIKFKNKQAQEAMITAGRYVALIFESLKTALVSDVTTLEIDHWIMGKLQEFKLISQTIGFQGYKHASCISINDELVHGVPRVDRKIKTGDLVKIDVCAAWQGYCADMARCFVIGNTVVSRADDLVRVAESALAKGIAQALPGKRLGDISAAIQTEVESAGFGVVRDFAGHGIGRKMHEDPEILNYGKAGSGVLLKEGMAFAIEPMITEGNYQVCIMNDGWTVRTVDGSLAAHVEDTIIITGQGPKIITRL
jgi:methionyl aminopeptidase